MDLPRITCVQADFGKVTAEAGAGPWEKIAKHQLLETVTGKAPNQATTFQIGWTPKELRVLFRCVDEHPWATKTQRDAALYEEEVVEVFLDPFGDLASYFEIEVNPLNAVLDLVLRKNRSGYLKDFAWNCDGMKTAAKIGDGGWSAELAIPFAGLTAEAPKVGSRWRAGFFRIDRPPGVPRELSAWSPTKLAQFHVPERFGWIEFR